MVCWPDGDDNSAEAWQTATAAEATTAVMVTFVSDAAVTLSCSQQSASDGGPVGNGNSVAIAMQ